MIRLVACNGRSVASNAWFVAWNTCLPDVAEWRFQQPAIVPGFIILTNCAPPAILQLSNCRHTDELPLLWASGRARIRGSSRLGHPTIATSPAASVLRGIGVLPLGPGQLRFRR